MARADARARGRLLKAAAAAVLAGGGGAAAAARAPLLRLLARAPALRLDPDTARAAAFAWHWVAAGVPGCQARPVGGVRQPLVGITVLGRRRAPGRGPARRGRCA
jgi:hypothetical protein